MWGLIKTVESDVKIQALTQIGTWLGYYTYMYAKLWILKQNHDLLYHLVTFLLKLATDWETAATVDHLSWKTTVLTGAGINSSGATHKP